MEPTVTITVSDYNKLIDKALETYVYLEKIITKIKSLYEREKNPSKNTYHQFYCVNNACDGILDMLKNKEDIPEAVKLWEENIDKNNEQ